MEDKILEIIKEKLPEQVGDVLRKRLDGIKELEAEAEMLRNSVNANDLVIQNQQREIEGLRYLQGKESELQEKEDGILEREMNLEKTILEIKLECAKQTNDDIINFVNSLMRNTVYRKSVFTNTTTDYKNGNSITVPIGEDVTEEAE